MSAFKKYHKLDFSALEDEILIEKVKENPPLCAKKLKSYKDMKVKDNIWAKIAREIGELGYNRTGEKCKKRWSNLRDYYVRKKKASSTGSAASSQGNEKFNQMKFLDSTTFVHRTTKSNVSTAALPDGQTSDDNEHVGDGSDIESQNEETEYQSLTEETHREENKDISETQEITATQVDETDKADVVPVEKIASTKRVTQSETHGKINVKKRRAQIFQDIDKGRSERMTLLRDLAQRTFSMPLSVEDPIDIFFKSLAATAKTLSPRYLAEAKRKLFLFMADIEEKNIKEKYPSSFPSPKPSPLPSGCPSSNPSPFSECPSSSPSPLTVLLPMSSPALSSHCDDSNSACHTMGQTQYGHPGPSYRPMPGHTMPGQTEYGPSGPSNNKSTDQEPMMTPDYTLKSYLAAYNP